MRGRGWRGCILRRRRRGWLLDGEELDSVRAEWVESLAQMDSTKESGSFVFERVD